jgi:hypothetical protein
MSKAISLTIETQTENRETLSLCHVNEKMIALETSFVANKMLKLNRSLFDKINQTTKMIGGTIYRQEITEINRGTNSTYTPIGNSYESREVDIARLFFEDNVLKQQQRAISKYGKKFDFDPALVSSNNTGGYFDTKKLSPDDIAASTIVSTVEEIFLFQNEGIKSFLITDNLEKTRSLIEVGYRIELLVSTSFDEYIKYVIDLAKKSINFLTSYLNSLNYSNNYRRQTKEFNPDYTSRMMESLGLSINLDNANLNSTTVKSSEFGQAAISYYNLASLLSPDVSKSVYSSALKAILPTDKTTPDGINSFIVNFTSLLESVGFEYITKSTTSGTGRKYSRVSKGQTGADIITAVSKEYLEIEQEILGYSVFSDSSGLNLFSSEDYKKRWALEQAKYYPAIDVDDASSFMTSAERGEFANISNAASYLTPTSLIMGAARIKTNRGMNNVNVDEVRQFRLAKSIRQSQQQSSKLPQSVQKNSITSDSLSALNVTIAAPKDALLNRTTSQAIDPLIDSRYYVGDSSGFTTNNPLVLLKNFKRILSSKDKRVLSITSDIIPRRFLRNKLAINSIKEIQFSNPNSIVRKLAVEQTLPITSLPPHIKFMMSKAFNPNPQSDPLKNSESREIIEETQKNLFVIKAIAGFEKSPDGFVNVHAPIYENIDKISISNKKPVLAKAFNYEVPELGIVKDNFLATIYSNLIYIRG